MKICFIADASDIHTERWASYFVNNENEVHVISCNPPLNDMPTINMHILKTYNSSKNLIRYVFNPIKKYIQIKKLIKEIEPDIIHGHSIIDHTILTALCDFHPFVVTPWGSDILIRANESILYKYAIPYTLKKADLITCDGINSKDAMLKMGIENGKIQFINHGIDTERFNPSYSNMEIWNDFKIIDSPTVLSTRRLSSVHDVGTFIKSIPLVLEIIPDAKFLIVGEGEEKNDLVRLAKTLDIIEAVKFVGFIPNGELPKYLSTVDIYVSTSLSDGGLAASTAEAMACGLPVIITDFGDNSKWVKDGENGFLFPMKDIKKLSENIIYLLENKDIRIKFGTINRKKIVEHYNHNKEMWKMENMYKELIKEYIA